MNKYIRAVYTNFFYFGISSLFFLFSTSIAIRVMGEDIFGLWSILNSVSVFSSIGNLGVGEVVSKFSSEQIEDNSTTNAIISSGLLILIPMAIFSCAILILIRGWMVPRLEMPQSYQGDFYDAVIFVALSLIPQFLSRIPHGYLQSQLKNGLSRFITLAVHITTWSGAIIIMGFFNNLKLMAVWMLIVQMVSMLFLYFLIIKMIGYQFKIDRGIIRRMTSFSSFSFLESLSISIFQQLDRVLVGFTLGSAAAGVYAVGTSVGLRLSIITGQITSVMMPYASLKDSNKEYATLFKNFRNMTRLTNIMLALMGGLLIVWIKEILAIWISVEYAINYNGIFSLLIFAYLILSLSRPGHQTLVGIGDIRFTSIVYLTTSLVMVACIFLLSPYAGLVGAAGAKLSTFLLLIYTFYTYHKLNSRIPWKAFFTDNAWAFLFTITGYLLILFNAPLVLRIIFSIALIVFVLAWCIQDAFLREQLKQILNMVFRIIKKNSSKEDHAE